MEFPEIKSKQFDSTSARFQLLVTEDNQFFEGHFDEAPIVPGVAQIHWALCFAKQAFPALIDAEIKGMSALKFQQVMQPNEQALLSLEYLAENNSLVFSYSCGEKKFSSGKLNLE